MSKNGVKLMAKLVWAYKALKELNNQTGFVEADDKVADKLLESGDVQNPQAGSRHLKHIETAKKPVKKEVKAEAKTTKDVKASSKTTKSKA